VRVRENNNFYSIVGNSVRQAIINNCENPISASELKKKLKVSWGTLYHHLKVLEENRFIKKEYLRDDGGNKLKGRKTAIQTNQSEIDQRHKQETAINRENYDKNFPYESHIKTLKILNEKGTVTDQELGKLLNIRNYHFLLARLMVEKKVETLYKITDTGKKFLEENNSNRG